MANQTANPAAVCVVGSINVDLVLRTPRMPGVGETIAGSGFAQIAGGKGANQAVAAARQGAATRLIACVGDDSYGTQSLAGLAAEGIATDSIHSIADCATGVAGIFVDDAGRNSIVIAPGANARLSEAHISAADNAIRQASLLVCQCETPMPTIVAAINIAHQHQVRVVFNPAPAVPLPDELLAKVHYLVVNETEATQLSGVPVIDLASAGQAASKLLEQGVQTVLLTLGEQGVLISSGKQHQHLPACRVQVVDTTAAGDTFVGAFAAALVRGLPKIEAVQEALYAAALSVTRLGAQSSIPLASEVQQFKKQHPAQAGHSSEKGTA